MPTTPPPEIDEKAAAEDTAFNARFEKALSGEAFSKVINKAFSGHSKRMLASTEFKSSLAEVFKSTLAETRNETGGGGDDDQDDDQGDEAGNASQRPRATNGKFAKGMDPEVKRQLDAAHRAAESAKKIAEDEKKKREESETRARTNEERAMLTEELSKAGVQKDMIGVALAFLKEEKRIARAEDGKVVWREGDDELEVGEGVTKWAGSPLGQRFLPPVNTTGSGSHTPNHGKRGANGKVEYSDADLGNMLKGL